MAAPVSPGDVLSGKYAIEEILGEGGMGVVVAARHLKLDQRVAIKFLKPEWLAYPELVERFLREARAASRIESDHVARVMDVDALPGGAPFMVMEHLEGSDLSVVRERGRPLVPAQAVDYVLQACAVVAEAHSLGIVHRDLKPANLFLARRRDGTVRVKVLDFGISKVTGGPGDVSVTSTSMVMGSAEYMSPEQMLSAKDVDARTDIWALGVVLYELCTATVPFPGQAITEVCAQVMTKTPEPPQARAPAIPVALAAVILRCLVKDRDGRYASVAELSEALAPFASGTRALPAVVAGPGDPLPRASRPDVAPPGTHAGVATSGPAGVPGRSRSPLLVVALAAPIAILALAGAGFLGSRGGHGSADPSPPQPAGQPPAAPSVPPGPAVTPAPPEPVIDDGGSAPKPRVDVAPPPPQASRPKTPPPPRVTAPAKPAGGGID